MDGFGTKFYFTKTQSPSPLGAVAWVRLPGSNNIQINSIMRLDEIIKHKSGWFEYNTRELVEFINSEYPGLGSRMFKEGFFTANDANEDTLLYRIEQEIEDSIGSVPPFHITDIIKNETGRMWHVIDS